MTFPSWSQERPETDSFGRYELLSLCGEGGMGRVYRAYDSQLKRFVALKFRREAETDDERRFIREAEAQARIDHPNVCKIFDAGKIEGRAYIAMQFIEGVPLHELKHTLSLREKAALMRDVALALDSAHARGLVHRDVKPGNILVERRAEGWWPYVVDFGLARDTSASATSTTSIIGTPHYISPEQAWGSRTLDCRTDVYSLGATMYELFTGSRPFEGEKSLDVIVQVLHRDPLALRKLRPDLPADLETVVLKCLEKEPGRRYSNAKAVADDLQRILDEEPIAARRTTAVSRALRKLRRNQPLFITLIATVALLVAAGSFGAYRELQSRYEARFAAEFGEEVRYIEEYLRHTYSLPLHDSRPEMAAMRKRLKDLVARVQQQGRKARRTGEFALGSGYLALSDAEAARAHLERAWEYGYRSPATAYALGRAFTVLYQDALNGAQRIADQTSRQRKVQQVEQEFRVPALRYLSLSRGLQTRSTEFDDALLAYHEKRFDESMNQSSRALARLPWLNEARVLRAQVFRAIGNQHRDSGDLLAAGQSYSSARQEYEQAIRFAPSDSRAYTGLCALWTDQMWMEFNSTGVDQKPLFEQAASACEKALLANPQNSEAWTELAEAYSLWARHLQRHGRDPGEATDEIIDAAQRAIALDPANAYAHDYLGQAYSRQADMSQGRRAAREAALIRAEQSYRRAVSLDPTSAQFVTSLGNIYLWRGYGADLPGSDPRPFWQDAAATYERAAKLDPRFVLAYDRAGVAYRHLGYKTAAEGQDPRPFLQKSIDILLRGVEVNPATASLYDNLGEAHLYKAHYEFTTGLDPSETLRQSESWYQRALARNPNSWETHWTHLMLKILQGKVATVHCGDAGAFFDQSLQIFERTNELYPVDKDAGFYKVRAEQYFWRSEWLRKCGVGDPSAAIDAGIRDIDISFKMWPSPPGPNAAAYAVAGALYVRKAATAPPETRKVLLETARRNLDLAFTHEPPLRHEFGHFADEVNRRRQ